MYRKTIVTVICAAFMASGCTNLPRSELADKFPHVKAIEKPVDPAVIGMSDTFDIDLPGLVNDDMFIATPLESSEPLPNFNVHPFSISNATLFDFMRIILDGSGISSSIDIEHIGANVARRSVSASNISGSLSSVLDTFSRSMGFYYYYVGGVLHVAPDRQFIAKLPPVNDLFDSLPPMLKTLGATDVFVDKTNRTVTYRATQATQNKADAYLKWVRESKKLIVYQTWIVEVTLSDATNTGVQWNKLAWTGTAGRAPVSINMSSTAGATAAAAGSVAVGTVFTGAHFSMDVLANFLKSQGTLNQLSRIPLMFLAGGNTQLSNGATDYYVSSIGAPTIAANGQVIQGQSQLSPLNTAMTLKLSGDIYDSTVFSKVEMSKTSLVGYTSFPAGQGQNMLAPSTTDISFGPADVRVRSGDTILIAGVNYEKFTSDISGLPGLTGSVGLATNNSRTSQHTELVIVMSPKIIQFSRNSAPVPVDTEKDKK